MDATAWVGIVGIGGTLLASISAPILSEWMRRRSSRLDRVHEKRLNVYADMLQATARFADNVGTWSAMPEADLKETADSELDVLVSQLRVVGSEEIYRLFAELARRLHRFNRELYTAKRYHVAIHDESKGDDHRSVQQRITLVGIADEVIEIHKALEAAVRKEVKR